ncbi:MAG: peptidoglycan D,D-transpeptidase FtsI family protein [Planctomycetota bacterium]|jgi:cell division protein FtsI/penicillin-binding protein 2
MIGGDHTQQAQSDRAAAWSRLFVWGMLLVLLVLLGRVVQLKLRPDPRLRPVINPPLASHTELAQRGDLLDARGRVIATSTVGYRLFVDPARVAEPSTVAVEIAAAIGASPIEIDRKILARPGRRYVVIDDLLDDWQVEAIRQARLRGVGLEPRLVRHYPHGELAASVVGRVGFEHTGLSGSEHAFDRALAPRHGRLTYLRDAGRRALWIEPDDYQPRGDGRDLQLTIDLVIQQIAERRLHEAVVAQNAGGGRVVVLDCRTGEILAMGDELNDRPGFNELTRDPLRRTHPAFGRNRCATDPYEPGSTFKPYVWAAATEIGKARPDEIIPTPREGAYRTARGRRIRDSHYHGPVSWRSVLVKSVNSGMAIVAERMNHDQMREAVTRFGFGTPTACGLLGESAGIVTSAGAWSHYTQTSVAMGHEIAVTPLQMARAFCVFARGGTLPPLRITAETDRDRQYRFYHRVCSEPIARLVRDVLREVMVAGTGRHAQSQRYRLFGKSGTAQLPRPDGGYYEDRYVSSFVAGAPYEEPRIVVLCVIDDPDKSRGHYGGAIAGPVVRDIIDETLAYLGVVPDKESHEPSAISEEKKGIRD